SGQNLNYSRSTFGAAYQIFCISSGEGTFNGRTTRNPMNCASVKYQMLLGNCGSWIFQVLFEALRAELRKRSGSSSHDPPRATCGYAAVGTIQGFFAVASTNFL